MTSDTRILYYHTMTSLRCHHTTVSGTVSNNIAFCYKYESVHKENVPIYVGLTDEDQLVAPGIAGATLWQ